jgi:lysophospholipase L1-like esterase
MNRPMRLALAATACAALLAACSLDNQTMGPQNPVASTPFAVTANIGTSLSAGFESGGINDSTQREGPMYQLAKAMGLTPGVDWFYPSFAGFGCPAPLTNPLTGARVGGTTSTFCAFRTPSSANLYMSNTAIPGLRAVQAYDLTQVPTSADTLKLAQFITGSISPVTMVLRQHPTFVTVEVGVNDVLAAATRGDTTFLTSVADFTTQIGVIADNLDSLSPKPGVAISNVPNVTVIPHFTRASTFWCGKTGLCGQAANPLFTTMSVDNSCAPAAAGGVGDSYLVTFPATGFIVNVINPSPPRGPIGTARLRCDIDTATVIVTVAQPGLPAGTYPAGATINTTEYTTITGRVTAFNTAISTLATARGYALVDLNATLAAQAAKIPLFPSFTTPTDTIFGTLFSKDGVHPTKAGYRIMAQAFATAINAKYSPTTPLVVP